MCVLAPVLTSMRLYRGETITEATGTDAAGTVDDLFGQPRKFCRRPSRLRTSTPLAALIPVNIPFFFGKSMTLGPTIAVIGHQIGTGRVAPRIWEEREQARTHY